MKRNRLDTRLVFTRNLLFSIVLIFVMFITACSPEWKTDIAWTIEGTINIEDGHALKSAENLKLLAMLWGDDPESKPGYGRPIWIIVSNVEKVSDGGEYSLDIDLLDISYEEESYDIERWTEILLIIWDDHDDDDFPDGFEEQLSTGVNSQERYYGLTAPPDSDYFRYGTVQFDYLGFPDCRGWVAGYRYFEDDYGATAPDNYVTEIDNGDVLTGVDLEVAVYD